MQFHYLLQQAAPGERDPGFGDRLNSALNTFFDDVPGVTADCRLHPDGTALVTLDVQGPQSKSDAALDFFLKLWKPDEGGAVLRKKLPPAWE